MRLGVGGGPEGMRKEGLETATGRGRSRGQGGAREIQKLIKAQGCKVGRGRGEEDFLRGLRSRDTCSL